MYSPTRETMLLTLLAISPTSALAASTSSQGPSKPVARTFPTPTAITARAFWLQPASSIFWRPCMPTKLPADTRHDRHPPSRPHALPGLSSLCRGNFRYLRLPRPPSPQGPLQIHSLVALSLSPGGHRRRLGDVPVFPLNAFPHNPFTAN